MAIDTSFLKPGAKDWESLYIPTNTSTTCIEDETVKIMVDKVEQANDTLKTILLQSLQMQNLVVLAGSGCSYHAGGPKMSDLWNKIIEENKIQAKSVAQKVKYDIELTNIEAFLSRVEAADFLEDDELNNFLTKAKEIILETMSSFLPPDQKELLNAHGVLLHRLSRRRSRDQRLRLFTTNYDLCFERAAADIGCIAIDGFSFMMPRQYDPRYFNYDIIRRPRSGEDSGSYLEGVFLLYKLHGSVNWEKIETGIVEKEKPDPEKACLIYPAGGKYQQSYNQPFIESISKYLEAIREPNTCLLVMGFGFNDDHLSTPLISAVRSNPHLRLIVVDPFTKNNADIRTNRHINELFDLSKQGEDIWFVNDSFEGFVNRIPDLKSLTPAEKLFKDIKGAMYQR